MSHMAKYRESHPAFFVVNHWINLCCIFLLIFTGFVIHYPFIPYIESVVRGVHIFCGFVVTANCLVRIVASFFIKSAPVDGSRRTKPDYLSWLPQKDNRHQLGAWIKYYLFIKREHPLSAKLGVPQKISYLLVPVMILIMFWTGLCMWAPTALWPPMAATVAFVGGAMSIRIIHYYFMFVIILFLMIHLYLANIGGLELTKLMLLRREAGGLVYDESVHNIVGQDPTPKK